MPQRYHYQKLSLFATGNSKYLISLLKTFDSLSILRPTYSTANILQTAYTLFIVCWTKLRNPQTRFMTQIVQKMNSEFMLIINIFMHINLFNIFHAQKTRCLTREAPDMTLHNWRQFHVLLDICFSIPCNSILKKHPNHWSIIKFTIENNQTYFLGSSKARDVLILRHACSL